MPSAAIASATSARCRSLATRLRITPAIRTEGSCVANPRDQSGGRLRLARDIEHEQNRQAELRREIGGGAAPAWRAGGVGRAVEQTHDAFDDQDVRAIRLTHGERVEQVCRHRPGIEIDARPAGDRGMKGRIDVVGSGFRRAHRDAAADERCQNGQRYGGLAGAGMRRGHDETARRHVTMSMG